MTWTSHNELDNQKRLTREGEDELLAIAERMQLRFPDLLNQPFENTNFLVKYQYKLIIIYFVTFYIFFQFRFTDTQRTRISAKQFATGLFGRNDAHKILFDEPLAQDPLLRVS